MGVDPRFERAVLADLRRVAYSVPRPFRPVAWLHHAREAHATSRALTAAGLSRDEVAAVDLLARARHPSPNGSVLHRARDLSEAPGLAALALLPDPRLAT